MFFLKHSVGLHVYKSNLPCVNWSEIARETISHFYSNTAAAISVKMAAAVLE